jgi:hypothetical protein
MRNLLHFYKYFSRATTYEETTSIQVISDMYTCSCPTMYMCTHERVETIYPTRRTTSLTNLNDTTSGGEIIEIRNKVTIAKEERTRWRSHFSNITSAFNFFIFRIWYLSKYNINSLYLLTVNHNCVLQSFFICCLHD